MKLSLVASFLFLAASPAIADNLPANFMVLRGRVFSLDYLWGQGVSPTTTGQLTTTAQSPTTGQPTTRFILNLRGQGVSPTTGQPTTTTQPTTLERLRNSP